MLLKRNIVIGLSILSLSLFSMSSFAKCEHEFVMKHPDGTPIIKEGVTFKGCYPDNYVDYTAKQAVTEFLKNMILVKGGTFHPADNPKYIETLKGYYIDKYMTPYQQYDAYLKATKQWHYGQVKGYVLNDNNVRKTEKRYAGLYPAQASYANAKGFCEWMGKKTGLPVTLASYPQWSYAATSRGTNWQYPTNNGKLEIGVNYPDYAQMDQSIVQQPVDNNPVNSLGVHQIFGNGLQWTSTILTKKNARKYNATWSSKIGGNISPGVTLTMKEKFLKSITLYTSSYVRAGKTEGNSLSFRCVINTDKPLSNK